MHSKDRSDEFRIERDTDAGEVRDFVRERTENPLEFEEEGVTVWNYSTHEQDREILQEKVKDLKRDKYIIPYQVPGAWAYITRLIPLKIRKAELLVWSKKEERYKAFPNFERESQVYCNRALYFDLELWYDDEYR